MKQVVKWSHSLVSVLRQCNRKFYLASIAATHGRKNPLRRKAYELKNMNTLLMWKGSVVDKFMELEIIPLLAEKKNLNFELLADQCVALAKEQFLFSKWKSYQDEGLRKSDADAEFCILDLHEVGTPYTESDVAEAYDDIRKAIENFPVIRMPDGKLLLTYLLECQRLFPNVTKWSAQVENAVLKPQIDLLAYHDFKPVVMDWKFAGSEVSDYSRQLLVCGLTIYLNRLKKPEKRQYRYKDISLYEVNILKGQVVQHDFTRERIHETINYINLTGADLTLLKEHFDQADINDFDLTENESSCKFCTLRSLCIFLLKNNNQYNETAYLEFLRTYQLA